MKKEIIFAFAAFFMMSLSTITGVYAGEDKKDEMIAIIDEKADISGDGKEDFVSIKGIRYEDDSDFLREVYIQIQASNGEKYKAKLEAGFDPQLQFIDMNQDGIKDLFISVETGGSGGVSNYYLYSLKDFELTDLTVPETVMMTTHFEDDYKASTIIQETGDTYTFDLKTRAKDYEKLGLYSKGRLNEPMELMVDPYSTLKPVKLKDGTNGLRGLQRISGANHADSIAFIESQWKYVNEQWALNSVKVIDIESSKQK